MKQRIILKETDLQNIIKETINRILKEEYSSNSNEGLTFYLPKSDTTQISHFLRKIAYVNNISKDSGCGNIGVNTETVTKRVGDDNIPYLKITVTPSVPEIKIDGYKYIGTITPMKLIINGENKEHMIVALSEEFSGNDDYKNILKQSSQTMKCDSCNRERARGIYCCFLEEETGKILKLGSSCAARYFGIDVASKFKKLFSALKNLGDEPYLQVVGDEIIGKYTDPVLSNLYDVLDDTQHGLLNNAILKGCWAIAKYGPNCTMKTSMGDAEIYISIVESCRRNSWYKGEIDESLFVSLMKKEEKENPRIFREYDQARELMVDFLSGSLDTFFYNMQPQNDFESRVQDVGLLITGGVIQKKRLHLSKYINIIPYCVQAYFKQNNSLNKTNNQDTQQLIQPFDGYKNLNVTITNIEKKQTRNGNNYYVVIAITDNNETAKWFVWNAQPDLNIGDKIDISATYNQRYKTLENVVTNQDDIVNYPDSGYKYINEKFTILTLTPKFIVVKNNDDNCEYFISNFKEAVGYYDTASYKFDLTNLQEGSEIIITGTVKSFARKNGTTGYSLIRVKGMPKYNG